MKGLKEYEVKSDKFEQQEEKFMCFPCYACKHADNDSDTCPCNKCGHNLNAELESTERE